MPLQVLLHLWERDSLESSKMSKPVRINKFMLALSHGQGETRTRSCALRNSRLESRYFCYYRMHRISSRQIWRKIHILFESVRFLLENAKSACTQAFSWGRDFCCHFPANSDMLVKSSSLVGPLHWCKQTHWLAYYIIYPSCPACTHNVRNIRHEKQN